MKRFWEIVDMARREIALRGRRTIVALSALVAIELVVIAGLCIDIGLAKSVSDVTLREVAPQTVLYTVYRGHYADLGPAINGLYELAIRRGLRPCGSPSMGYLNNPSDISSDHWLIEIRLPVDAKALAFAGKLGGMTDVKSVPAMKVAVAAKPLGQADPEAVIRHLSAWINRRRYIIAGRLWQSVVCNGTGDDCRMSTEFVIPVYSQRAAAGSHSKALRNLPI